MGAASLREFEDDEIKATDLIPHWTNEAKGIDIADIIELRKKGLSCSQIAAVVGCSKKNIQKRLQGIMGELESVGKFKEHRADVLAVHQMRLLNSINDNTIKKASLKDRVVAMGVLFDKEKIETGKTPGGVNGRLQINIINFAGASQTGQIKVIPVNPMIEGDQDEHTV